MKDDYLDLIARERERLERLRVTESENAALKNANAALHRKLDALEGRPAVRIALGIAAQIDRAPRLKGALRTMFHALKGRR